MTVQVIRESGAPADGAAEPYDFQRPTALAREQSRALQLAFETFARQWGTQVSAKLRVVARVSLDQVTLLTYDDYVSHLPAESALVLCAIDGITPRAVVQLPISHALGWVARMVGGAGARPAPSRPFTPIEQAIVRRVVEDALEDLRYSFGGLLPDQVGVESIHVNAQFAQAAAVTDSMIVATLDVRVGETVTTCTVALPAELLLPQLGRVEAPVSSIAADVLVRDQLATVPLEVSLTLAPLPVAPSAVLDLAVGDVLTFPHPHHRPLDLTVDGQTVARAAVGANGSRLACVVVSTEESAS
ncbi:MAG: flagellar motor switch protein FliM [Microbacteriaceae bacterium]